MCELFDMIFPGSVRMVVMALLLIGTLFLDSYKPAKENESEVKWVKIVLYFAMAVISVEWIICRAAR